MRIVVPSPELPPFDVLDDERDEWTSQLQIPPHPHSQSEETT